jgi:hypothetical protein
LFLGFLVSLVYDKKRRLMLLRFLPFKHASKREGDTPCRFDIAHRPALNFARTAILPRMLVKLFEHAEVFAHIDQRRSLVRKFDLDASNVSRIFTAASSAILDRDFLNCRRLVPRQR